MSKFHINDAGDPGKCSAQPGNCPFGAEADHYGSRNDARKAYEKIMGDASLSANSKVARKEHQMDMLHNLNYDRVEAVNRATAYDGDRIFSIYFDSNSENTGLFASYGQAIIGPEGNLFTNWTTTNFIAEDDEVGRGKAKDQLLYTLRSLPEDAVIRNNLL